MEQEQPQTRLVWFALPRETPQSRMKRRRLQGTTVELVSRENKMPVASTTERDMTIPATTRSDAIPIRARICAVESVGRDGFGAAWLRVRDD
jgi:hypothetical protein